MPSRNRIVVTVPKALQERLLAYSKETGVPYSEAVRRAVVAYLDAQEKKNGRK